MSSRIIRIASRVAVRSILGSDSLDAKTIETALKKFRLSWSYDPVRSSYAVEGGHAEGGVTLYWNRKWGSWGFQTKRSGGPLDDAFSLWEVITSTHWPRS